MYPNRARFPGARLAAVLLALGFAGAAQAATYTLRPEATVEQALDDNVLAAENRAGVRPSREVSSWTTYVSPLLTIERKSDTSEGNLLLGITRRKTWSLSELDGSDERVGAAFRRVLTPRLSLGARGRYEFYEAYDAVQQGIAGSTPQILFAERPDLRWRTFAGDFKYALDDSTELTGEIDTGMREYDETTRTDLYDSEDRGISFRLARQLSQVDKIGAVLGYDISEERRSESSFGRLDSPVENDLATLMGYWERSWNPRWGSVLQVGVRALRSERDDEVALIENPPPGGCPGPSVAGFCLTNLNRGSETDRGTGFIGGLSLVHRYSDRGQISASYLRDTRTGTSSATGASAIDTDSFSAGVSHKLSPRVTLSLRGSYLLYDTASDSEQTSYPTFVGFGFACGPSSSIENVPLPGGGTGITCLRRLRAGSDTRLRSAELRLDWQVRKNMVAYTSFSYFDLDQDQTFERFGSLQRDYARRILTFGFRYSFDHEL